MPLVKIDKCLNCGVAHEWIFEGMSLRELRVVKQVTGLRTMEFAEACEILDPDAVAALIYVLHKRDDISIQFDDVDADLKDFVMEETEGEKREREAEEAKAKAEADPKSKPKIQSGPKSGAASRAR